MVIIDILYPHESIVSAIYSSNNGSLHTESL